MSLATPRHCRKQTTNHVCMCKHKTLFLSFLVGSFFSHSCRPFKNQLFRRTHAVIAFITFQSLSLSRTDRAISKYVQERQRATRQKSRNDEGQCCKYLLWIYHLSTRSRCAVKITKAWRESSPLTSQHTKYCTHRSFPWNTPLCSLKYFYQYIYIMTCIYV